MMGFILAKKGTLLIPTLSTTHLHFICNDPVLYPRTGKESVLLVNISSIKPSIPYDKTCELNCGDHSFITRPSFVYYRKAEIYSASNIQREVSAGNYSIREDCEETIFNKVLNGFASSEDVSYKILRFYENYCK